MALPPRFLDELRDRIPVSDVVGRRVRLIRAGREYKACCPFHKEKTPSFYVNDDKGFFHCFGCGAHGDVIGFVMRHDNLEFMEAVEALASTIGLPVPKPTPEEARRAERQKGLYELVEAAVAFFRERLAASEGAAARAYLEERGLTPDDVERFRLGYAPADGRALLERLKAEGFEQDQVLEAGLARRPDDGRAPYAFFRNRLMFPVADRRGRPVAFGARLLDGDGPKYINSPDTPLFHKGQLLYGLSRARQAVQQGHPVIVAEGYMDVISLVRAGWRGAVAPLGTALTEPQIAELWRLAPVPVLCFDGDEAGRRAAWRAIDRVLPGLKPDHSVSVAFLPPGEDPDSLIRSRGSDAFRPVLEQAKPLAQAIWERAVEGRRLDTPEAKAGLRAVLEATAGEIGDAAVREFYRREIRQRLDQAFPWRPGVDRQRRGGFGQAGRFGGRRDGFGGAGSGHGPAPHAPGPDQGIAACILLAVVISHPTLAEEVGEALASLEMPDPSLDALKQEVIAVTAAGAGLDSQELRDHLCQTGHGRALERVAEDRIAILAPFARPAASLRQARAGWHGIWRQIEARRAGQDLKAAQDAFARDPTAENLARLRALQAQTLAAAAHGADGGAEEEYRSGGGLSGGAGASDGGIGGEEWS